jgi:site-specific recombinase XerD
MSEDVETFVVSKESPCAGLLDAHVDSFLTHLFSIGYAERTRNKKRSVASAFVRWTSCRRILLADLNDTLIDAFVLRSPGRKKGSVVYERSTLKLFINYLRCEAEVPTPEPWIDSSVAGTLHRRYLHYLRNERGLCEHSVCVYSPYVRTFLTELVEKSGGSSPLLVLNATVVQEFLLERVRNRSSQYARLLTIALRSFLRFLFLRGEISKDLSASVPPVRRWNQASVPAVLTSEEVESILSTIDRSTPCGRRDYAIVLLLARLGLRAGEVAALELDDINWRTGQILIHGKGGVLDHLPLLEEVGKALSVYLRKDRDRSSASRRVFLRMYAPCIGLSGPAAVGHVVRKVLAQAGISRRSRGAAHLFRHSLATRMIRHGASMTEISEVLRHRSQSTTALYAKVDFESLRAVSSPWPGGAR